MGATTKTAMATKQEGRGMRQPLGPAAVAAAAAAGPRATRVATGSCTARFPTATLASESSPSQKTRRAVPAMAGTLIRNV